MKGEQFAREAAITGAWYTLTACSSATWRNGRFRPSRGPARSPPISPTSPSSKGPVGTLIRKIASWERRQADVASGGFRGFSGERGKIRRTPGREFLNWVRGLLITLSRRRASHATTSHLNGVSLAPGVEGWTFAFQVDGDVRPSYFGVPPNIFFIWKLWTLSAELGRFWPFKTLTTADDKRKVLLLK